MALKKILENLDGLDQSLHALYKKGEDGKFHLDIEDDDAGPLRRAKEHEVNLRKLAEQESERLKGQVTDLTGQLEQARSQQNQSTQELRTSLEKDFNTRLNQSKESYEGQIGALRTVFVKDVAERLAGEISTVPDLLAADMAKRLQVEIIDGQPVTRVLSRDGKPSAMSLDELKQEYFTNAAYAPIMRASNGSGGGANGANKNGAGGTKALAELSTAERVKLQKERPEEFARLVAEAAQASQAARENATYGRRT